MNDQNKGRLRKVMFKRHAHLFTLISIVWTVFTLLAISNDISLFVGGNWKAEAVSLLALGIWGAHAVFIGLSIYFWRTERESVLMVELKRK